MITEDYCSYEVAKLLKEKGFPMDEHLFIYVNKDGKLMTDHQACLTMTNEEYRTFFDDYIPTVTQSLAMKWLRSIYNKHCDIGYDIDLDWFFQIIDLKELVEYNYPETKYYHTENETGFSTYERAVDAALKYCLTELI